MRKGKAKGFHNKSSEELNRKLVVRTIDEDCQKRWSEMGKQRYQPLTTKTAKPKTQSKASKFLSNPDVKRWYDNLSRGSKNTADARLRRLIHVCEVHQMTPMQLAELGMKDEKAATDLIQDHITLMEQQGKAPGYIRTTVTAVKSWLRHFDVEIRRKIRIANADSTPTLEEEKVPEAEEMAEVLRRAPLRESSAISFVAKSGLRPEVLGNHDGTDGLKMKDLPDIAVIQGVARCLQSPSMVIVRKTLSKARHQYFTFMTTEETKTLLAYLNDRLAKGEPLNAESPLIEPTTSAQKGRGKNSQKPFLPTPRISDLIREVLRPRFLWRPYIFRAYFDTQLLIAESKGRVAHDFRQFWMGHKGSIEAKYTTNKGVLPDALINEMREAFKRCQEFLDIETKEEDTTVKQREFVQTAIAEATPEVIGKVLEILVQMSVSKTNGQASNA